MRVSRSKGGKEVTALKVQKYDDTQVRVLLQEQQLSLKHRKMRMKKAMTKKIEEARGHGLSFFRKVILTWKRQFLKGSNSRRKEMNYEHTSAVPLRGNWQTGCIDGVRVKDVGNKQKVDFKEHIDYVKVEVT